ncbi:MAG TPA: hypothetical protein VG101_01160 [Puia sp.]|jgi:hypothetical protein|nr:hypothetical protein [Puia sp.]
MKTLFLYIDPGSGSYLVQVIIAAILGGAFWIKKFWRGIRSFFTSLFASFFTRRKKDP